MKVVLWPLTWTLHQNLNLGRLNLMSLLTTWKDCFKHLIKQFILEKQFIGDLSKVKKLSKSYMEKDCNALIQHVKESFVGCALKIHWQYTDDHSGDWHSSELSKKKCM